MLEITIDKLPGGDATRRRCRARIVLVNTGQGVGGVGGAGGVGASGVSVYDARVEHAEDGVREELAVTACKTYRDENEQTLRLVHRALGRLLGEEGGSAMAPHS